MLWVFRVLWPTGVISEPSVGDSTDLLNQLLLDNGICGRASLVAQMVKHLPAMWEARVWSLGQEGPLRRKWQPTLVSLPAKSHGQRSLEGCSPRGRKESGMTEQLTLTIFPVGGCVDQLEAPQTWCYWDFMETFSSTCACSVAQLFAALWAVACQTSLPMEFSRQEYWSGLPYPPFGGSSRPRDWTFVSCIGRQILYHCAIWEAKPLVKEIAQHKIRLGAPFRYWSK